MWFQQALATNDTIKQALVRWPQLQGLALEVAASPAACARMLANPAGELTRLGVALTAAEQQALRDRARTWGEPAAARPRHRMFAIIDRTQAAGVIDLLQAAVEESRKKPGRTKFSNITLERG